MGLLAKIQKHGLKDSIRIGSQKPLLMYYQAKARFLRYPRYKNPTIKELTAIEQDFKSQNIKLHDYFIDINSFNQFNRDFIFGNDFYEGQGSLYLEKILEHFIAYDLGIKKMPLGGHYIDVAACSSPWVKLLREREYTATAIDLMEPTKRYSDLSYYKVMDATKTAFNDSSIDCMSMQCAYEMFIKNDDVNFIKELSRILKKGGRTIICPLYMHTHSCGYCTAEYWHRKDFHDSGAKLYLRDNFIGVPFSRKYNVNTLKDRILNPILEHGLAYKIWVLRNGTDIDSGIYCHFILDIYK